MTQKAEGKIRIRIEKKLKWAYQLKILPKKTGYCSEIKPNILHIRQEKTIAQILHTWCLVMAAFQKELRYYWGSPGKWGLMFSHRNGKSFPLISEQKHCMQDLWCILVSFFVSYYTISSIISHPDFDPMFQESCRSLLRDSDKNK